MELKKTHLTTEDVFSGTIKYLLNVPMGIRLNLWPHFHQCMGGFREHEFSILCGSTGSGKTTLLANISAQLVYQKINHFVMSVETGFQDFMIRVISCLEKQDLNLGEAISKEYAYSLSTKYAEHMVQNNLFLSTHENRISSKTLLDELRFQHEINGCKIALMDNLNFFLHVTRAADSMIEMDRVIHDLIIFCKDTDMHLLMVMHPRKTFNTRVLSEFDIRGSSTAVQEASNVLLFNRPAQKLIKEGIRNKFDRELTFQKLRKRGFKQGSTVVFKNVNTFYDEIGEASYGISDYDNQSVFSDC